MMGGTAHARGSTTMILEISLSPSDVPYQTPQASSLRLHGDSSMGTMSHIKMALLLFLQLSVTCFENKSTISFRDLRSLINN
jgi:hypothetical protein